MERKHILMADICQTLPQVLDKTSFDRLFILTDEVTIQLCLPVIKSLPHMQKATEITIPTTDTHKTLDTVVVVWNALQKGEATRHSLLLNLGGGMVTDLGGFAASTFKRGIPYINIPTTLLSMVDASVGGKTGFNFGGLKNEIGVFNMPYEVLFDTVFLHTLDSVNLLSGYAEMLKHSLLCPESRHLEQILSFDIQQPDWKVLGNMIETSVGVKQHIVDADPHEHGLRKALNLGHTFGHAFESLALKRQPVLHGYAVAWGLVCELYLSCLKCGFPTERMRQVVHFVKDNYGQCRYTCNDYPELVELMTHDKKNTAGTINFTLLADVGELRLNQTASRDEIYEALDFLREG